MDTKETDVIKPLFLTIPEDTRLDLLANVSRETGLNQVAIEKDWWISAILRCVFSLDYAESIQFKGLCVAIHKPFYEQ